MHANPGVGAYEGESAANTLGSCSQPVARCVTGPSGLGGKFSSSARGGPESAENTEAVESRRAAAGQPCGERPGPGTYEPDAGVGSAALGGEVGGHWQFARAVRPHNATPPAFSRSESLSLSLLTAHAVFPPLSLSYHGPFGSPAPGYSQRLRTGEHGDGCFSAFNGTLAVPWKRAAGLCEPAPRTDRWVGGWVGGCTSGGCVLINRPRTARDGAG